MFNFIKRFFIRLKWEKQGVFYFSHYKDLILVALPDYGGNWSWTANRKMSFFDIQTIAQGDKYFLAPDQAQRDALRWLRSAVTR